MEPIVGQIIEYKGARCLITYVGKMTFETLREDGRHMEFAIKQYKSCKLIGTLSLNTILNNIFDGKV